MLSPLPYGLNSKRKIGEIYQTRVTKNPKASQEESSFVCKRNVNFAFRFTHSYITHIGFQETYS